MKQFEIRQSIIKNAALLVRLDERVTDQGFDVPSIIFEPISYSEPANKLFYMEESESLVAIQSTIYKVMEENCMGYHTQKICTKLHRI